MSSAGKSESFFPYIAKSCFPVKPIVWTLLTHCNRTPNDIKGLYGLRGRKHTLYGRHTLEVYRKALARYYGAENGMVLAVECESRHSQEVDPLTALCG